MDYLQNISITSIFGLGKNDTKLVEELRADLATAKQRLNGIKNDCSVKSQTAHSLRITAGNQPTFQTRARAAAAEMLVKASALDVERIQMELDVLHELPDLLRRIVNDYIPLYRDVNRQEKRIADQTYKLAQDHVRQWFYSQFDPKVWPVNDAALNGWIESHPVVMQARNTSRMAPAGDNGTELKSKARSAIDQVEDRIQKLSYRLGERKKEYVECVEELDSVHAELEVEQNRAAEAAERAAQAEEKARTEAVRRLAKAAK